LLDPDYIIARRATGYRLRTTGEEYDKKRLHIGSLPAWSPKPGVRSPTSHLLHLAKYSAIASANAAVVEALG
jgi:hypothetical protein